MERRNVMYQRYNEGWIEVITGCMFAGKTEEFIRRIQVLRFAKKKIVVFKPKLDNRYRSDQVVSHSGSHIDCYVIQHANEMCLYLHDQYDVIAVDEIQFFDEDMIVVLNQLADQGKRVIVSGLDMDFRGEPFGIMAKLITQAEFVTKLTAVCMVCGAPATRSQRLMNGEPARFNEPIINVGASECYEARCRHCHVVPK